MSPGVRFVASFLAMLFLLLATASSRAQTERATLLTPDEAFSLSDQLVAASPSPAPLAFTEPTGPDVPATPVAEDNSRSVAEDSLSGLLSPEELTPTLRTVIAFGLLGLIPAALLMTTCFARFAIVLGLLRQGLGAQQWLPNQIVLALSLFLTLLVMAPVWTQSYENGIRPYLNAEFDGPSDDRLADAWTGAVTPIRQFMSRQIAATGNEAAIGMLMDFQRGTQTDSTLPQYYEDVPLSVLLPAYLLSELKTAFVIGFQIVLPFLIIDLVVASVLTGMGLMMLPPVLVSLPFKLLLFVLIDGWTLTVELLLHSLPAG